MTSLAPTLRPRSWPPLLLLLIPAACLVWAFLPTFGVVGAGGLVAFLLGSLFLFDAESGVVVPRSIVFGVGGAVGSTVGAAVGGDVGGGVGRGVAGGAVGGGVGVGAAVAAWTTIDPCMVGWIEQWYAKVPATPNGIARLLAPGAS